MTGSTATPSTPAPPASTPSAGTRVRLLALLVAAVAIGVYANTAGHGFALDDNFIIRDNPRVHGLEALDRAVSEPYWPNAPGQIGLYRPLTSATYAVQWEVWEGWPAPYHWANIALHAAVSLLVLALLLRLAPPWPAAAGALLFAVHPVHTEAVANVVGRAELLAALFFLAACLLYLAPRRAEAERTADRWWAAGGVAALYLLALCAKEIAITLPGVLLLLECVRSRQWAREVLRRWPVYAAVVAAAALYLVTRAAVLGTAVGNDEAGFLRPLDSIERVMTAVSVWPEYLRLLLFPAHLVADYSPGVLLPVTEPDAVVWAGLLVGLAAALIAGLAWRGPRLVSIGVLWFVVMLLPVSNIFFAIGVLLAERTLYLPSVGLALATAGALAWLARRLPARQGLAYAVVAIVLVAMAARTWTRNPVWRDTSTVLRSLAADHPESFRVQWLQADQLNRQGRTAEALQLYRSAVALVPFHYQLRTEYGQLLVRADRPVDAVDQFRVARDAVPSLPDAAILLVDALSRAGRTDDAVAAGRAAVRRFPDHRGAHHQLAIALTRAHAYEEALVARRAALRLAGPRAGWTQHLHEAELLLRAGRADRAAQALDAARSAAADPAAVPDLDRLRAAIAADDPAVLPYR